ncbi:hypothetical protein [Microvirga arsenatis]|uniref:Uncharacterized protein n=1 Tax=Microvirga arsenatis TaxID=2692265 RepID=A0ABW9YVW2_9HYPH|nr:hypothetical protein [Microvirga arsenatis]NBJ10564.1 hypothetical protein [Microvirga arsenatis]NBJ24537.1 hypothetical protein [Microvirga arsenatis]
MARRPLAIALRGCPRAAGARDVALHHPRRALPVARDLGVTGIGRPGVCGMNHRIPVLRIACTQRHPIVPLQVIDATAQAERRDQAKEDDEPVSISC